MEALFHGTYYRLSRKIKEKINFEEKFEVPDGLESHEVLSLVTQKNSSFERHMKSTDNQFAGFHKVRVTLPSVKLEQSDDTDVLDANDFAQPVPTVVADDEFADVAKAAQKPKKGK